MPITVNGSPASSTDPATWATFDEAGRAFNASRHAGIGFAFSATDPYVGIDLDGCRDPETGTVTDWALDEVKRFDSYTEISPSETGLKIWIRADTRLMKGRNKKLSVAEIVAKKPGVEVYSQGRYFAVTGNVFRDYIEVNHREPELLGFLARHWPAAPAVDLPQQDWRSDDAVVERARKYVARIPGAVSGSGGSNATFSVACSLVRGFDLSPDQAFVVLQEWNATCLPPWSEPELQHKLSDAAKAGGETGYLRNAKPERWDTIQVPECWVGSHLASGRPEIELSLDEKAVNDQVIVALASRADIFEYNGCLAVIGEEPVDGERSRKTIQRVGLATLREIISETCSFYVAGKDKDDGTPVRSVQRIPKWTFEAIHVRGHWTGMRPIRGIVNCPVLRADGSILQAAGYDAESGLYVDLTEEFPLIASAPPMDDVQCAWAALIDLVSDFPFANAASASAWIAGLLTPLAREAYHGATGPLFLVDANVRGSGKSLLVDIISLIVTGHEAVRLTASRDDEEMGKRITSMACNADRIVLIDNIAGRFGCASLDSALTGTTYKGRRLGQSEMIESPLRMTWYGTGNNVILEADTARRVCQVRLESPLENPEDREGFRIPDILRHVRQHRRELLMAALTILRGYIAAGRPRQKLKSWGSFEGWSDLVRAAIVWSGLADPGETRTELRATSDSEASALRQMLNAMSHIDPERHGLRTSDLLKIAKGKDQSYPADDVTMLADSVETFCGTQIEKTSTQKLGNQLSHCRNRVIDQMALDCTVKRGSNYWFVRSSGGPGGPGGPLLAVPPYGGNTLLRVP